MQTTTPSVAAKRRGVKPAKSEGYQARFLDPNGKRQSKTFLTVKDAEGWLAQQRTAVSNGTWDVSSTATNITFGAYADGWLDGRKVRGQPIASRTREGYRDLLDKLILPTFGYRPLHTITRDDVDDWYDRTAVDSPTYRARGYSLLRTILNSAVEDDKTALVANPARIRGAGSSPRRHQPRILELGELQAMTDAMPGRYKALVQLAFWGGFRFGEITELRVKDIDLERATVHVRRAVVAVGGGFETKKPKSDAGVRDVTLPRVVIPILRGHMEEYVGTDPEALLFPAAGDPTHHLRQSSLAKAFYPARKAAGRPDFRWHDFRHTCGTLMAQQGATMAEIMGFLGHSTMQAAMRYQHAAEQRQTEIADRMSAMAEGWAMARLETADARS